MIRRGTWLALLVLLALVGFSVVLRNRQAKISPTPTPTQGSTPLFEAGLGEPVRIRVEDATGAAVELYRNPDGMWTLAAPEAAEVDQGAAQAAATQIGALRILSTVDLAPEVIGLDAPAYTLTLEFKGSVGHRLLLGSVTPITDGYYAQLDRGPYQVVDKYGLDELIGLLSTPPYLATPEPEMTSSTMPAAPTGSALTPEVSPATVAATESPEPTTATAAP